MTVFPQMMMPGGAAGFVPLIQRVSFATADADTLTMPTHQSGDMIVMAGFSDGTQTTVGTGSGNTSISSSLNTNTSDLGMRVCYRVAASSSETFSAMSDADVVVAVVLRSADGTIGFDNGATGFGATSTDTDAKWAALTYSSGVRVLNVLGARNAPLTSPSAHLRSGSTLLVAANTSACLAIGIGNLSGNLNSENAGSETVGSHVTRSQAITITP